MEIEKLLSECLLKDKFYLKSQYQKISRIQDKIDREQKLLILEEKIQHAINNFHYKRSHIPALNYPDLPIVEQKQKILEAILANQVIVVAGETGSGKTTQLPKIALEAGLGISGMIGHTQPRRLAARTVAMRIASELNCILGSAIGYEVRFSQKVDPLSYIKIMTDGILLNETHQDKWLNQYDCLIIDEAHERSLNIDFLLGYLKNLLAKRNDLKVIITSATIDLDKFSQFFNHAPIIEVSGRTYPVEINYLPPVPEDEDPVSNIAKCVEEAVNRGPGDILIFQSGEKEIREVVEDLSKRFKNMLILPLYARLSVAEQQKVFQTFNRQKIIVSTNVAETSITVPNIRYVIDPGFARISRYSYRNKLQRLPIEPISQASCNQRAGRCGRVGPGICYRLYSKDDFINRPLFTEPEILRTNLAGVILKMLSLGFKEIENFSFLDPPDSRFIKDGFNLLERLNAVDENKKITPIGRVLATLPIEPKLGRMIIAANQYGALREILIIVSGLSINDPRERPIEAKEKSDESHAQFVHEGSDFMGFLNLWDFIFETKKRLSHNQFRKLCYKNFLSYVRVCEWFDVHEQLQTAALEAGFRENQMPADFAMIHKSLLTGIIDGIGVKEDKKEYLGARGVKFYIHPSSSLFKKSPPWLVSCEIVYTSKTFARINAQIETKWIEEVSGHLLKKSHIEPYYSETEQRVIAFEKGNLFGLEIYNKRKVNYEKFAPKLAREIFIQQGLVEGKLKTTCLFYRKNKETLRQLEDLENRIRRQVLLVDETLIYKFYADRISLNVNSRESLEKWLSDKSDAFLTYTLDQISASTLTEAQLSDYPETLIVNGEKYKLEYKFDLQAIDDGVTLLVPIQHLKNIKDKDFSWLIKGFLEEKIAYYLKALPKNVRAQLLPLPYHIHEAKSTLSQGENFTQALLKYVQHKTKLPLVENIWDSLTVPPLFKMHFKVIDQKNNIHMGDDLHSIYAKLKDKFTQNLSQTHPLERENILQWDIDELPKEVRIQKGDLSFNYYPAFVDVNKQVNIQLFESIDDAIKFHAQGLTRFYMIHLVDPIKYFRKSISSSEKKTLSNLYADFGEYDLLIDALLFNTASFLFVQDTSIRTKQQFHQILNAEKKHFLVSANLVLRAITEILTLRKSILIHLEKCAKNPSLVLAVSDIQLQLKGLFQAEFIKTTPWKWLKRFSIYLKAIGLRLEKATRDSKRDQEIMKEIKTVQKAYQSKMPFDVRREFYWSIEELRVSLFAQSLGTIEPVSKVRLLKALDKLG